MVDEFIFELRKYSRVSSQYSIIEFVQLPRSMRKGGTRCPQRVGKRMWLAA